MRLRFAVLFLPVVGMAIVWGCSGDDSSPARLADGGGVDALADSPSDTRDSGGDGRANDAGPAADATADAAPVPWREAQIFATQPRVDGGGHRTVFAANFFKGQCTTEVVGSCIARQCNDVQMPSGDGGDDDLGVISFNSRRISAFNDAGVSLFHTSGGYRSVSYDGEILADGETLDVSATGGALPGFSKSIIATSDLTVTSPDIPNDVTVAASFSRSVPLDITWTGAASGQVQVELMQSDYLFSVTCVFPGSAGSGQVPASLLQKFKPNGSTAGAGEIGIVPFNATSFASGDNDVNVSAFAAGKSGSFMLKD